MCNKTHAPVTRVLTATAPLNLLKLQLALQLPGSLGYDPLDFIERRLMPPLGVSFIA